MSAPPAGHLRAPLRPRPAGRRQERVHRLHEEAARPASARPASASAASRRSTTSRGSGRRASRTTRREARGEPRLVSERTPEGYNITRPKFRGSLVDRFNEAIAAELPRQPGVLRRRARCSSSSRAASDDGFRESLERFDPDILRRGAILYIKVSFEESFRRNSARYKPGQEESILFHKVPDRDMLGFFRDNDWAAITGGAPDGWLDLRRRARPVRLDEQRTGIHRSARPARPLRRRAWTAPGALPHEVTHGESDEPLAGLPPAPLPELVPARPHLRHLLHGPLQPERLVDDDDGPVPLVEGRVRHDRHGRLLDLRAVGHVQRPARRPHRRQEGHPHRRRRAPPCST